MKLFMCDILQHFLIVLKLNCKTSAVPSLLLSEGMLLT